MADRIVLYLVFVNLLYMVFAAWFTVDELSGRSIANRAQQGCFTSAFSLADFLLTHFRFEVFAFTVMMSS